MHIPSYISFKFHENSFRTGYVRLFDFPFTKTSY